MDTGQRLAAAGQRGSPRLLESFSHHDSDCLMVVLDLAAAEQFGGVELTFLQIADIERDRREAEEAGFDRQRRSPGRSR